MGNQQKVWKEDRGDMIKNTFGEDCSNCGEGKGGRLGSRVEQRSNMVSQEAMATVRLNVLNLSDITFRNPNAQDRPRPFKPGSPAGRGWS